MLQHRSKTMYNDCMEPGIMMVIGLLRAVLERVPLHHIFWMTYDRADVERKRCSVGLSLEMWHRWRCYLSFGKHTKLLQALNPSCRVLFPSVALFFIPCSIAGHAHFLHVLRAEVSPPEYSLVGCTHVLPCHVQCSPHAAVVARPTFWSVCGVICKPHITCASSFD